MNGFIIKFRGKTYRTAVKDGALCITVTKYNDVISFTVGAYRKPEETSVLWLSVDSMEVGDEIEIEVADIPENEITRPVSEELYADIFKRFQDGLK